PGRARAVLGRGSVMHVLLSASASHMPRRGPRLPARALAGTRGIFRYGSLVGSERAADPPRSHREAPENRSARSPRRLAQAVDDPRAGRAPADRAAGARHRRAPRGDAPGPELRAA